MKRFILFFCLLLLLLGTALADEHSMGSWVTKREATCTQEGLQFSYCNHCDHWEQRPIKKLPHTPDQWVVIAEPTCTQEGAMGAHCTVCGGYIRKKIDKLGHDWVTISAKTPATCNAPGEGEQQCSRCGRIRKGKLPRLEHEWTEWEIPREPAGKKKGARERTCVLCGKVDKDTFYYEGTLYEGMSSNPEVIRMQTMLKDLGYYGGKISSGSFGSITGKAVAKFQKANGLPANEVCDPATMEALESLWEQKTGRSAEELKTAAE